MPSFQLARHSVGLRSSAQTLRGELRKGDTKIEIPLLFYPRIAPVSIFFSSQPQIFKKKRQEMEGELCQMLIKETGDRFLKQNANDRCAVLCVKNQALEGIFGRTAKASGAGSKLISVTFQRQTPQKAKENSGLK
ncbi:MAG: hypothetical protein LUD78_09645 [Clostridiales bacterium]|nr:hypothetical protein [Clostridiales bacterium]